jgi:DNA-binding NtrC family response regulator
VALDSTERNLTLVSQDRSDRFGMLLKALGELDYDVHVAGPDALKEASDTRQSLVYLGMQSWDGRSMGRLKAFGTDPRNLLALEKAAFRWAEPTIRDSRDFVTWPCGTSELKLRLERCGAPNTNHALMRQGVRVAEVSALGLVGQSQSFLDSLVTLRRFAECDATVLVQGETGTGKELAARAIHQLSARKDGPFMPVCCGALPDTLIEAELFGHARGAFTDAREARPGLVEQAQGGTLFLDEVEALSPKAQAALLRFLESLEYRRVGGAKARKADVRVIAAGNEDLHRLARSGAFRSDLAYRLDVLSLTLPALRKRPGDVDVLAKHFLDQFTQTYKTGPLILNARSRDWMTEYGWPGNVRELENAVHKAVVTAREGTVSLLPDGEGTQDTQDATLAEDFCVAKARAVKAFERRYLEALMRAAKGNVTRAAEKAGKERRALGKLLKKHGIDAAHFSQA